MVGVSFIVSSPNCLHGRWYLSFSNMYSPPDETLFLSIFHSNYRTADSLVSGFWVESYGLANRFCLHLLTNWQVHSWTVYGLRPTPMWSGFLAFCNKLLILRVYRSDGMEPEQWCSDRSPSGSIFWHTYWWLHVQAYFQSETGFKIME